MPYVAALLIFLVLSAACWFVAAACYRATYTDAPVPPALSGRSAVAVCAVGAAALTGFVPFPLGYAAHVLVWAVAAFGFTGLPHGRAAVFVGYLALASALSRLVALGALSVL